jgi:hypothetical protein
VSSTNTEDPAFISHDRATELRNAESVIKRDLVRNHLVHVKKVNRLAAPLKVVHELVRRVTLFEDESVVQQLVELVNDIDLLVVGYFAT